MYSITTLTAFSPRFGFSWDPTGKADWVIRGGFGIYHDWTTLGNDENGLKGNPPGFGRPDVFPRIGHASCLCAGDKRDCTRWIHVSGLGKIRA